MCVPARAFTTACACKLITVCCKDLEWSLPKPKRATVGSRCQHTYIRQRSNSEFQLYRFLPNPIIRTCTKNAPIPKYIDLLLPSERERSRERDCVRKIQRSTYSHKQQQIAPSRLFTVIAFSSFVRSYTARYYCVYIYIYIYRL